MLNNTQTITVAITEIDTDQWTCFGTYNNKRIEVDPYVANCWDHTFSYMLGFYTATGHWYSDTEQNVFLPFEMVFLSEFNSGA